MNAISSTASVTEICHQQEELTSSPTGHPFVTCILKLTNQERHKHGLQPLTLNARLTAAAQAHSKAMALCDQAPQPGVDRASLCDRVERTGYRWSTVGENVAYGQTTPEAVMLAWMASDGERRHILNPEFREIGIGYYFLRDEVGAVNKHHYWVQTFAMPK